MILHFRATVPDVHGTFAARRAEKVFQRLDRNSQDRVRESLRNLVDYYDGESENPPDVKHLHGKYRGLFRIRVGNLRILFKIERDRLVIIVIDIVSRGDAYKS